MSKTVTPSETAQWFTMLGLGDMPNHNVNAMTLSNGPIEHWFYKRNKLRAESLLSLRRWPPTHSYASSWPPARGSLGGNWKVHPV
jgi:hypothetical protein